MGNPPTTKIFCHASQQRAPIRIEFHAHRASGNNRGADPWNEYCCVEGTSKRMTSGPVPCSAALERRENLPDAVSRNVAGFFIGQ